MSQLKILYFAWVRERIGQNEEDTPSPSAGTTIAELLDRLSDASPAHATAFAERTRIRAALDQRFVSLDTEIGAADELALFPPVTGG